MVDIQSLDPELSRQIEKRRQDARDKKIFDKGKRIALSLGHHTIPHSREWSAKYTYTDGKLEIRCYQGVHRRADYSLNMVDILILHNGKRVFLGEDRLGLEIESYVPGDWERGVDTLYDEISKRGIRQGPTTEDPQPQDEIVARRVLRERFGL